MGTMEEFFYNFPAAATRQPDSAFWSSATDESVQSFRQRIVSSDVSSYFVLPQSSSQSWAAAGINQQWENDGTGQQSGKQESPQHEAMSAPCTNLSPPATTGVSHLQQQMVVPGNTHTPNTRPMSENQPFMLSPSLQTCYQQQHFALSAKHPASQQQATPAQSSNLINADDSPDYCSNLFGLQQQQLPLFDAVTNFAATPSPIGQHHQQQSDHYSYHSAFRSYQNQNSGSFSLLSSGNYQQHHVSSHVPISSASWLEPPPAPGDAEWSQIPFDGQKMASNSRLLRSGRRRSAGQLLAICAQELDDDSRSDSGGCAGRQAANVRERRRMKLLNEAFGRLRNHVPQDLFSEHKRSKLTVLRGAIRYIQMLSDTLIARGGCGKAGASMSASGSGSAASSRQQVPQSIVIKTTTVSGCAGNARHRVSWRISDSAVATVGRISPRPTTTSSNTYPIRQLTPQELASAARLRYSTWRPLKSDPPV